MQERWMKIKPAAAYGGCSERTYRKWLKKGLVHSRLSGGLVLTHTTNIDIFLRKFEIDNNEADRIVQELLD
jgi:hypothetical protein